MKVSSKNKILAGLCALFALSSFLNAAWMREQETSQGMSLLPELNSWKLSESPQNYVPGTLYEYINGAAEIYLSYNFIELTVAQYQEEKSRANMTVEIYDMGSGKNSFGIYSAERYPESRFIPAGIQGYMEEGVLNFLIDKYYIKLLCFDGEVQSEEFLEVFAHEIAKKVMDKGRFPELLAAFPKENLLPNTEKYFLNNFLGYDFFHDGYLANYKLGENEFDCWFIEGKSPEDAQSMLNMYLAAKKKESTEERSFGYFVKDPYYHNIYLARVGNYVCGVMKIKGGFEETGEKYLRSLIQNLKGL